MREIILNEIEKEVLSRLKNTTHLCLYGAGTLSLRLLEFMFLNSIRIEMIIVSEKKDNPDSICGIPVVVRDEIPLDLRKELNVYIALEGKANRWIDIIQDHQFNMVYFFPYSFLEEIRELDFFHRFEVHGKKGYETNEYYIDMDFPYAEWRQFSVVCKKTEKTVARLCVDFDLGDVWQLYALLKSGEIQKLYSNVEHIPYFGKRGILDNNPSQTDIFIITTVKDKLVPSFEESPHYHPLQVGAVLSSVRKDCIQDDSGENISNRNRNYSECTGLYWIWRNTLDQQYVGLEHYRRRLGIDDSSLEYMNKNDIDFVVPTPQFTYKTVKEFFRTYLGEFDWNNLKESAISLYPEIEGCFDVFEKSHFYLPCNMGLWKREWFDKYCEFAFGIADRIYGEYNKKRIVRDDRYMGYIFECLHTLFVMMHKKDIKVMSADIEFVFENV